MNVALPDRPDKAVMWIGHYAVFLLLAAVAGTVANAATGERVTAVTWAASAAWMAWMAAWAADACHKERLCERCIAASPLDPQAAVTRHRVALRMHHAAAARAVMFTAIIGWDIAGALFRSPPPWVLALDALAAVLAGLAYLACRQHRRLYPWCPFCRWDEGGDHEVSPDVPAPAVTR